MELASLMKKEGKEKVQFLLPSGSGCMCSWNYSMSYRKIGMWLNAVLNTYYTVADSV